MKTYLTMKNIRGFFEVHRARFFDGDENRVVAAKWGWFQL
jgi:hypothetical protein